MVDYEDEKEEEFGIEELNDSDFADEHRESTIYVVHRLLCNQKAPALRNDIKSFIQGVRSRAKYVTSLLTAEVVRILFLEHSWTI